MLPVGKSSKREYCVSHHRTCHHKQESRSTMVACTLDSLLGIHLDHLRAIFCFRLQLRKGRHHTYNPSLTNAPTYIERPSPPEGCNVVYKDRSFRLITNYLNLSPRSGQSALYWPDTISLTYMQENRTAHDGHLVQQNIRHRIETQMGIDWTQSSEKLMGHKE